MAAPTLLLTRPFERAQAFVASLDQTVLAGVRVVIAPLMAIVRTGNSPRLEGVRGVIFTSVNGVCHAPDGAGRAAYCVGAQTTQKAVMRGWSAVQLGDTAQELVAAMLANPPAAPLIHLSGVHTRGNIAQSLSESGLRTYHTALYSQALLPLEQTALIALEGPCIVPVFSPRSAAQLQQVAEGRLKHAYIIALSSAVADAFPRENLNQLLLLPAPRAEYMRRAVENLCKILGPP